MVDYPPNNAGELAARSLADGDATGWFEKLYAGSSPSGQGVPWAQMRPNDTLVAWLDSTVHAGAQHALVVGCGLGDDAEELSRRGFTVTAFDVSPSAVALCRERFPASTVTYMTADLFHPPHSFSAAFDLVVEVYTVQSLPPHLHEDAIRQIAGFASPGGRLFVSSLVREASITNPSGPPWPVSEAAFAGYLQEGLTVESQHKITFDRWSSVWRVAAVYRR